MTILDSLHTAAQSTANALKTVLTVPFKISTAIIGFAQKNPATTASLIAGLFTTGRVDGAAGNGGSGNYNSCSPCTMDVTLSTPLPNQQIISVVRSADCHNPIGNGAFLFLGMHQKKEPRLPTNFFYPNGHSGATNRYGSLQIVSSNGALYTGDQAAKDLDHLSDPTGRLLPKRDPKWKMHLEKKDHGTGTLYFCDKLPKAEGSKVLTFENFQQILTAPHSGIYGKTKAGASARE
jgi:hypothetical protein